jgi:hypothetical protein
MRSFFALAILMLCVSVSRGQNKIPEGTAVTVIMKEDIDVNKYKQGDKVPVFVAEDVKVNGTIVIPANAPVKAMVTNASKPAPHKGEGELRIDFLEVMAMDGTTVKLNDCWLFTTGAENPYRKHYSVFVKGTRKNCTTVKY